MYVLHVNLLIPAVDGPVSHVVNVPVGSLANAKYFRIDAPTGSNLWSLPELLFGLPVAELRFDRIFALVRFSN